MASPDPGRATLEAQAPSAARWYRSLYWRIAIGFVLCLAAMLVVQAMLFVWVLARSGRRCRASPSVSRRPSPST